MVSAVVPCNRDGCRARPDFGAPSNRPAHQVRGRLAFALWRRISDGERHAPFRHALQSATKPRLYAPIPDLPSVLQELNSWLADEHQWRSARASNWTTLLGDLVSSWENLGPSLRRCLGDDTKREIEEVKAVRKGVRRSDHSPDESPRRRLERATRKIKSSLLQEEALLASWRDMVDAPQITLAVSYARLLLALAHLRGQSPDSGRSGLSNPQRYDRDITRARGGTPMGHGEYPRWGEPSWAERLRG